jgi:hypothetical protein
MRLGRTYEVFVDGKPVGLVGSTTHTLTERRRGGYVKRFGPSVELRLIREVPRPEGYSDLDYNFRLKAAEAMDIVRKKTYIENGGLNKVSPLLQAFGHPMLEAEIGKIGGRVQGRRNVESGHLASITTLENSAKGGRIGGPISIRNQPREVKVRNGRKVGLAYGSINGPINIRKVPQEVKVLNGLKQGAKNVENGHWDRIRVLGTKFTEASGHTAGLRVKELGIGIFAPEHRGRGGRAIKELGVGVFAPGMASRGGRVGTCKRWNIDRGNPCVCGEHQ